MEEYRRIFSKNLQRLLEKADLLQGDLAEGIGVHKSVVSSWINCTRYPRMNTIEQIATFFGVEKSELIEEQTEQKPYYLNAKTAEMAQQLYENRGLRILFDAAKDASPEDLALAAEVLSGSPEKNFTEIMEVSQS